MPQTFSIAVFPVSSEYWNSAKALRNAASSHRKDGRARRSRRIALQAAPSGVRAKRSPLS